MYQKIRYMTATSSSGKGMGPMLPSLSQTNVLFVTGAMPPSSADAVKSIEQQLGKGEDREVKVFYLQSGLNYEAMNLGDKLMMKVFCKMMKSRKAHSEEEKALFEQMQKSFDVCEKANLEPMLNYIQGL